MNTRQSLPLRMDASWPAWLAIRILPKILLAAVAICALAAFPRPGLAAPASRSTLQIIPQGTQQPTPQVPSRIDDVQPADHPAAVLSVAGEVRAPLPSETTAQSGVDDQGRAAWRELEPGLLFGEFQLNEGDARLTVLRIDPAAFDFTLCARSLDGGPSRPLNQWGEQYNLVAAINASMYLPDGSTSTGYMRQGEHVNNGRVVQRFGAFFVAGPDEPSLPPAAILDRDGPVWRQQMEHYSLVIQNYRMINADRRILWSPGGPHYSISAVAQDGDGHILFMHCRQPVEAYSFAQQVLHLPLNVRTVMYVEGGGQAGLLVRSPALTRELVGLSPSGLLVTGDLRAVLPNVLGARRKSSTGGNTAAPAASVSKPNADSSSATPAAPAPSSEDAAQAEQPTPGTDAHPARPQDFPTGQDPAGMQKKSEAPTEASMAPAAGGNANMPSDAPVQAPPAAGAESPSIPDIKPLTEPLTEPGTSLTRTKGTDGEGRSASVNN